VEILGLISEHLQIGDDERVAALTAQALEQGIEARRILESGLIAGMNVVGERFREREIFLPDVLLASKAMQGAIDLLRPRLAEGKLPAAGTVVIGTVQGDLHDIGKNLVGIMLRGAGFEVLDLGHDVPPVRFIATARESQAHVIGMSALLTTTMPAMRRVVDLLREEGLAGRVRTIIGGAPVSETFARDIGADAYAYDGANAVERVKALVGAPKSAA
jgi:5-methyltetrahydrofolate--homocysteine methyltransferase